MLVNIRALIAECEMLMVISSHDLTRVDGGWPSYFYYLIVHFAAGTLNQFSGKASMLCTRPPPKLHKNNSFFKGQQGKHGNVMFDGQIWRWQLGRDIEKK